MKIIPKRKIYFTISGILVLASILIWIALGLNLGIDFTGGSLLEIEYTGERQSIEQVQEKLGVLELDGLQIQPTGDSGYILRFKQIQEQTHQNILNALNDLPIETEQPADEEPVEEATETEEETEEALDLEAASDFTIEASEHETAPLVVEKRFNAIGPVIGTELKTKSIYLILVVILAIVLYIAWAFRKVSYPVQSWKYGIISIIALIHDVLITLGIFILLGKFLGIEVNTPFVAALLTILGYSVNDSIVVFDRIRENLGKYEGEFEEIVDKSVNETITRSINTSFTTLLVLVAIFVFGGTSIRDFILALIIGIALGTYSSIFVASPLLVVWQKISWKLKKE